MDFFCDVVLWFMLLIGLILMLLPSDIFASIAQMNIVFPAWINAGAKALAIAGAVGIVLMSGREKKNPALRLALGAYDLYNVSGWAQRRVVLLSSAGARTCNRSNRIGY